MRVEELVSDLIAELDASASPGDRDEMLRSLQRWLKSHLEHWSVPMRDRWGLDQWAAMDLRHYPIDRASLDPDEELRRLKAVPPDSLEVLAMRLRDLFWAGITVESSVGCPRCGHASLRVLEDASADAPVLACDLCAWSQTPDGNRWAGTSWLHPASRGVVDRWRDEKG